MSVSQQFIATCDVDGPNCLRTAAMPAETVLPPDWMSLNGNLFGAGGGSTPAQTDACGACVLTLGAALPASWLAVMPQPPS